VEEDVGHFSVEQPTEIAALLDAATRDGLEVVDDQARIHQHRAVVAHQRRRLDARQRVGMAAEEHAFAVTRPPGHHARPTAGMGFCVFNNILDREIKA